MNLSGENIILYKDQNIEINKTNEYKITGEKIVEMFENHKKTFSYYFSEIDQYTYHDVYTIYKKVNAIWYHNNLINYILMPKLNIKQQLAIEKCAYVQSVWGENYYHFLIDEIPNMIKINNFDKDIPIICNYNNNYIKEILDLFNFTNKIIKPISDTVINIKECILTHMSKSGVPAKSELQLIRNYMKEKNIIKFEPEELGIIIKRRNERSILNFNKIVKHLENTNIKWIVFEESSFSETIKLFSKCKYILAAHGAGLTNMLFAPEGCEIIELIPSSDPNECYHHLATCLNHNYSCIVIEDTGKNNGKHMNVKLEYLDKIIGSLNSWNNGS